MISRCCLACSLVRYLKMPRKWQVWKWYQITNDILGFLFVGVPGKFEHNPAVLGSQTCPALRSGVQVIISKLRLCRSSPALCSGSVSFVSGRSVIFRSPGSRCILSGPRSFIFYGEAAKCLGVSFKIPIFPWEHQNTNNSLKSAPFFEHTLSLCWENIQNKNENATLPCLSALTIIVRNSVETC